MSSTPKKYPLLAPLAVLWGGVTMVRNALFDGGFFKSYRPSIPTLCVGNVSVGGTGKTPMVEWLLAHLSSKYRLAVVSRGYRRKSKGLVVASSASTVLDLGDEPMQMHLKFPHVPIVVCADRQRAFRYFEELEDKDRPQLIIMDDGLQHRRLSPHFSLLLTTYERPYFQDYIIPWGRLRESRAVVARTSAVVVTKCPQGMTVTERRSFRERLGLLEHQPSFFSFVRHQEPKAIFSENTLEVKGPQSVVLLAGIASVASFFSLGDTLFENVIAKLSYSDHYRYSKKDLATLESFLDNGNETCKTAIVTTEKDAVKLRELASNMSEKLRNSLYYLPIETDFFTTDGERLIRFIEKKLDFKKVCNYL